MTAEQSPCALAAHWEVRVPGLSPYGFTRVTRTPCSNSHHYQVVWVDARRLLACADRSPVSRAAPVAQWYAGKRYGMEDFLMPIHQRVPEMPRVAFRLKRRRTLFGLLGLRKEGVVTFLDGMHRAQYMAFAGATQFPVEVHVREAALLQAHCGAQFSPAVVQARPLDQ